MGNKLENNRPLAKNQAPQALLSGESGKQGNSTHQKPVVVTVPLIQLNPDLLPRVSKGGNVTVRWGQDSFCCFFKAIILGKIPPNYNGKFEKSSSYRALISSFKIHPPAVTIEINL